MVCEGFYKDKLTYYKGTNQEVTVNTKLLINDTKPGEDNGQPSWYPLPFVNVRVLEESETIEYYLPFILDWQ